MDGGVGGVEMLWKSVVDLLMRVEERRVVGVGRGLWVDDMREEEMGEGVVMKVVEIIVNGSG